MLGYAVILRERPIEDASKQQALARIRRRCLPPLLFGLVFAVGLHFASYMALMPGIGAEGRLLTALGLVALPVSLLIAGWRLLVILRRSILLEWQTEASQLTALQRRRDRTARTIRAARGRHAREREEINARTALLDDIIRQLARSKGHIVAVDESLDLVEMRRLLPELLSPGGELQTSAHIAEEPSPVQADALAASKVVPARRSSISTSEVPNEPESVEVSGKPADGQPLVLVVEDNPLTQQALTRQLRSLGYGVTVAGNGLEALQRWRDTAFDLVLTDCEMPECDGYLLTSMIRAEEKGRPQRTPIVACTSHSERSNIDHCLSSGADDVICKPVFREVLRKRLAKWVERPLEGVPVSSAPVEPEPVMPPDAVTPKGQKLVLDREMACEVLGDDPAFHQSLCLRFIAQSRESINEIEQLLDRAELDLVAGVAHRLKSAAASIAAQRTVETLQALNDHAKAGEFPQAQSALQELIWRVDELEREYERIIV